MSPTPPQVPAAEITADELLTRLRTGEPLRIIDVREPDEFAAGHIPGAQLIPLGELPARYEALTPPAAEWIMVCRSGNRSGKATAFLRERGYSARNLLGGMLHWPGPVETGP